jgi:hypothetical protein
VHDLLADVHLPETLEEAQDGDVQPLPAVLTVPLRVHARVHDLQQTKDARRQIAVDRLLRSRLAHLSEAV